MSQDLFRCPLGSLFKKEIDEENLAALPCRGHCLLCYSLFKMFFQEMIDSSVFSWPNTDKGWLLVQTRALFFYELNYFFPITCQRNSREILLKYNSWQFKCSVEAGFVRIYFFGTCIDLIFKKKCVADEFSMVRWICSAWALNKLLWWLIFLQNSLRPIKMVIL